MQKYILAIVIIGLLFVSPLSVVAIQGDSMEPTIPNDGLLFTYETSSVSNGDIITFYSEQTNGYVTHRIIETTNEGTYITLGDNNAVPDQDIGIAPVTTQQVESKALSFNGSPLYLPYLGGLLLLLQSNLLPFTLLTSLVITILYAIKGRVQSHRLYSHMVAKDVFQPIFIITVLLLVILFMFNATVVTVPFVYTENVETSQQQYVIQTNQPQQTETVLINSTNSFFTNNIYVVTGFDAIEFNQKTPKQMEITAQLPEKNQTGVLQTSVTIYKVPGIIPQQQAQELGYISPVVPILLSILILISPFYLLYHLAIGPNTPIRNPKISQLIEKWEK